MMRYKIWSVIIAGLFLILPGGCAEMTTDITPENATADKADTLQVDTSTLTGKVMCGYQGWFTCEGDSANRGWFHWGGREGFKPGSCSIDLWPDMTELEPDERYDTPFRHADGSVAQVFSSMNFKTVNRHFKWMQEYGIDGVFVQRFAGETMHPAGLNHCNTVLRHCRESANTYGRAYAVMYDLSGLGENSIDRVIADWKSLVDEMKITRNSEDKAYLNHNGKPVVAVWGIGFNDNRKYTLQDCAKLIDFLKNDPDYGQCTVMVGVPTFWRTLKNDALNDPYLLEVVQKADIISPWMVGRFGAPDDAGRFAREVWKPDIQWCNERGKDYLPVVFPGFSWHNMFADSPSNAIPRLGGKFLWRQYQEAIGAGATMIYQAMFDEVDEGTAIFKCTNNPPVGESTFIDYEGLPADHYLWLTGMGARALRGEIELTDELPVRE